jgi:preprotein translocase subunit SecG
MGILVIIGTLIAIVVILLIVALILPQDTKKDQNGEFEIDEEISEE